MLAFVFYFWLLQAEAPQAALVRQGDQALAARRYAEAEAAFAKLAQQSPGIAEIHAKLGVIYFQQGKFAEAVPALQRALKLKPALPNAGLLLAMSLSELGRFTEALAGLEKGFRGSPPPDPALRRLSGLQLQRAYTGLKRDADAVQVALDLSRAFPDDPEVLYHSGRLFGNMAYLTMSRLASVAPDSVFRLLAAGEAHESAGNFELAAARYREALALAPGRPGLQWRLGRALLRSGAAGQTAAAAAFAAELATDPTNGNAAYELAEIERQAGNISQAQERFEQAVRLDPDFEEAHIGLAKLHAAAGRHAEALRRLAIAIRLNPDNEVPHYQAARSHRALGQAAEERRALDAFRRLRDLAAHREALLRREVTAQVADVDRER